MDKQVYITSHSNNFGSRTVMTTFYKDGKIDWSTRVPTTGNLNQVISRYKDLGYTVEVKQDTTPRRINKGLANYSSKFI
tara:strand:- start:46307 stop:46543 length:237 start_codon:yes stop_codon:yes gene_type:complete